MDVFTAHPHHTHTHIQYAHLCRNTHKQLTLSALFQVAQLHHELNLKDELLQFYTNAAEESEDESSSSPTLASLLC